MTQQSHRFSLQTQPAQRGSARRQTPLRLAVMLAAVALAAGCSSLPERNANLEQARSDYAAARSDSQTASLAASELTVAGDALKAANDAFSQKRPIAQVDHLAHLARQRVAIAQALGQQKAAEAAVSTAEGNRDKIRLAARTNEVDAAQRGTQEAQRQSAQSQSEAEAAQRQAALSQGQTEAAQRQAALSQGQADAAQRDAASAQQQAAAAQQQASDAGQRAAALSSQLDALNAKKTDRGMVITIGDVLFDTDQAALKSGGLQNIERLGGFLKQYPQRKAAIEGYTDSSGSGSHNQALSARRAEAVMAALVAQGVGRGQLVAQGFGETHPVAGNDSSGGRQLNRRVEILLSDESGALTPR